MKEQEQPSFSIFALEPRGDSSKLDLAVSPKGKTFSDAFTEAVNICKAELGLPDSALVDIGPTRYDTSELHAAQKRGYDAVEKYYRQRAKALYS